MNYNYRYRLKPTESQRETLDYHRDTCRQLYNHALYRFTQTPEDQGTVKQRVRTIRNELPDLKNCLLPTSSWSRNRTFQTLSEIF
jgi:putative transposase